MINEIEPEHWTYYQNGNHCRIVFDDTDAVTLPFGDTFVMFARIMEGLLRARTKTAPVRHLHYWILIKLLERSRRSDKTGEILEPGA